MEIQRADTGWSVETVYHVSGNSTHDVPYRVTIPDLEWEDIEETSLTCRYVATGSSEEESFLLSAEIEQPLHERMQVLVAVGGVTVLALVVVWWLFVFRRK
ncbi:hypothetical protein [Halalkalicoccus salilacus]|uniref:hypothetical protein n=1 Tax=Halalkalicoccus TaxID=332246 RepID=UPI002F961CCE